MVFVCLMRVFEDFDFFEWVGSLIIEGFLEKMMEMIWVVMVMLYLLCFLCFFVFEFRLKLEKLLVEEDVFFLEER